MIFADWPRGLYLAKKLSEEGRKTAYVEIRPRTKNPFGIFLDESFKEEKEFLENLGFLFRQEGGFCLLSPQGVWPLQEMEKMKSRLSVLRNTSNKDSSKDFEENWLSFLSLNLTGKVFEYNNSKFSEKCSNFFADYFLFEPSFKKMEQFYKNHPEISFYKAYPEELALKEDQFEIAIAKKQFEENQFKNATAKEQFEENQFKNAVAKKQFEENQFKSTKNRRLLEEDRFEIAGGKKSLTSQKFFWLSSYPPPFLTKAKALKPCWQWKSCFFKTDFMEYKDIIPSHFVLLKDIFLPWSHDNLLNVFHKEGQLEVGMRVPYKKDQKIFLQGAKRLLEDFFKGLVFQPIEKSSPKGSIIYGPECLEFKNFGFKDKIYIEDLNIFSHCDLASEIRAERELFKGLSL